MYIYIKALTYCEKLTSLKNTTKGQIQLTLAYGTFEEEDLEGCQFVIAATDDRALNRKIAELCKEKNILINTVDDKELCSFYFSVPDKAGRGCRGHQQRWKQSGSDTENPGNS